MADPPHYSGTRRDSDSGGQTTGTPRWVKAFGIIAVVLALLFVILHLTGGGPRGHRP